MRKVAVLFAVAVLLAIISGCSQQRDMSKESLQPHGEPNPQMKTVSPGGSAGPGAGEK